MEKTTIDSLFAFAIPKLKATIAALALCGMALPSWAADREFELSIDEVSIDVAPELKYKVFAFNEQVPGPLLHVEEGDDLTIHVTNNTSVDHTIHWHGIHMQNNWQNDGVPGVTQKPIAPGDTFTYRFKADRIGSLWYHCHVNVNEHVGIRGMWGPLVVAPKKPEPIEKRVTKDVIMMLSTWESDHAERYGEGGIPRGVADYFSVNGRSFPYNQPLRIEEGDVVRVRFYGAGGGIHNMHSHGHDMLVTHKDGLPLSSPYYADTVMVGPGERYDVIIEAKNPGLFIFHDHVDTHVTAGGKHPGGPITIMEYKNVEKPDFYVWKNIEYDSNYFYSDSMALPYGLHNHDGFKGKPLERERRRRGH